MWIKPAETWGVSMRPMTSNLPSMRAAAPPERPEEGFLVALMLGFAGGYIDAYTWIIHGVFANAQTANLVFLWVNAAAGQWWQASQFVPPLFAFLIGIVIASQLRRAASGRAGQLGLVVEVGMLILVGFLHNRVPEVAGTIGISVVAAIQTSIFTRVEGSVYSSVMIAGNVRQAIEGAFALAAGDPQMGLLRKSCIYTGICAMIGAGAAAGAFLTERLPTFALIVPIAALLLVLLLCASWRPVEVAHD
jgi:uncharacterized membrane protein YoaK (UPF0700 family)